MVNCLLLINSVPYKIKNHIYYTKGITHKSIKLKLKNRLHSNRRISLYKLKLSNIPIHKYDLPPSLLISCFIHGETNPLFTNT